MKAMDKNTYKRRLLSVLGGFFLASYSLAPVYASDTEVYARDDGWDGDIAPVLMMVLDSSGSMNTCLENCSSPSQRVTRIQALREAMRKTLFGVPPAYNNDGSLKEPVVKPAPDFVKMGYSRFNPDATFGGWMRYPALKLSSIIDDKWTETGAVDAVVRASADDAVQGSPLVVLTGSTFSVGQGMSTVGLRFADLEIPKGATITGALLYFNRSSTSGWNNGIPSSVNIAVQDVGNANAFTTTGTNISGRSWALDAKISSDFPNGDSSQFYFQVKDYVQRVVNKTDWCGGNALAFRLNASDANTNATPVFSQDGSPTLAPSLVVSYEIKNAATRQTSCANIAQHAVVSVKDSLDDIEWVEGSSIANTNASTLSPAAVGADGKRNQIALRFDGLNVPQAATVDKAWLYVTSFSSGTANASVQVQGLDKDNVTAFCTRNTDGTVPCTLPGTSSSDLTTASANLVLPGSTASTAGLHRAIEVTSIVQSIVDRSGWAAKNGIGFLLRNPSVLPASSSNSSIYAADSSLSRGAFLHVVFRKKYTDLDQMEKTARQDLYDDITTRMFAEGGTPLGDAYAEAARYMLGEAPGIVKAFDSTFGEQAPIASYNQPDPRTATNSGTAAKPVWKYNSPMENFGQCAANYIYVMSDGEPNNASNVSQNTDGVIEDPNKECKDYANDSKTSGATSVNFQCMMALAKHLSSGINQKKSVIRTNTVLFDDTISSTDPIVQDMTTVARTFGEGTFFLAKNSAQLTDSLLKTMTSLLDQSGSITAPGVAVNQFNRLTHLDQLYYAVFDPNVKRARWRGNVKRYRLKFIDSTLTDGSIRRTASIVDSQDVDAVDPKTSFFKPGSWSWWSPASDGNNAIEGGAASRIPDPADRKFYTYLGSTAGNLVTINNVTAATGKPYMGLAGDDQYRNARNWLLGYNLDIVDGNAISNTYVTPPSTDPLLRKEVGGVLHSQPVLVNYGYNGNDANAAAADPSLQDNMVFFSTMEGSLHAVDANSGVETFAYMPKELLATVPQLIVNDITNDYLPKFGLDSTWTVWRVDGNKDLKITTGGSDKVHLFGGMRMGGRTYYGLDVTNRAAPRFLWSKSANGSTTDKYFNMGQTWSEPVLADFKVNGVAKTVLVFAGGYDPKHETEGFSAANASDAMGNQIYMVDPADGSVIWWASNTGADANSADLKFSITTKIKTFDSNKDGLIDALYFGDLGGQVFRIDLNNSNSGASSIAKRIQRIANLGQGVVADSVNHRRFYEAPSVAILYDAAAGSEYVAVALGSGYRSHPLNTATEDFFYVLRDNDVLRKDLLTTTSLQSLITPSLLQTLNLSLKTGATLTGKMGWMIDLPQPGEKVLTTAVILFGEVFFTSYVPQDPLSNTVPDPCQPVLGYTKLWRMSVTDGAVLTDFNNDKVVNEKDRLYSNLAGSVVMGLGGAPQVLVGEDGKNAIITGTGVVRNQDLDSANMRRTRWYEKSK